MKNIYIIGFMGTGKSTIANIIQSKINVTRIDVDDYIVEKTGMAITDIFEEYGEDHFRNVETECLKEIAEMDSVLVSCGGGIVLREENIDIMKNSGKVVLLTATPETIYERVCRSSTRPILNGNMSVEYIKGLMDKRKEYYDNAYDVLIDTDEKTAAIISKEIITLYKALNY